MSNGQIKDITIACESALIKPDWRNNTLLIEVVGLYKSDVIEKLTVSDILSHFDRSELLKGLQEDGE